jgi:penicillin-binding protein 2
VGFRMGITRLNEYSRRLGLGELTGIEIGETAGTLASPEFKESRGGIWVGGDLLQSAIGQSDNQFSPLQTANMLSTVLNGGYRYRCHLLLYVKEYGSDEIYYAPRTQILDSIEISDVNAEAVRRGMRDAISTGTGRNLFNDIPMRVGGKTGTAQISANRSNNATFVAFAPYTEPELSVSVVIEKGAHGSWAGFVAEDVIGYYFGYRTFEESIGAAAEGG